MANKYWVPGGDGIVDHGNNWALSSGGAAAGLGPTTSDACFFDGNSGSGIVSVPSGHFFTALSVNFTGFLGTFDGMGQSILDGDLILSPTVNLTYSGLWSWQAASGSGTANITCAGQTLQNVDFQTGLIVLQDNFLAGPVQIDSASLDTNGFDMTCTSLLSTSFASKTVNLRSSTVTLTGSGSILDMKGVTLTAGTSTIKITDPSSSSKTVDGRGRTFNNLWFTGGGTGALTHLGDNTWNNIKVDAGLTIKFADGSAVTVATLTMSGATMTKQTSSTYSLTITGGVTIGLSAMTIDHCDCLTPTTFYAGLGSVDGGNNTNVIFANAFTRRTPALPILISPIDKSKLRFSF